MQVNIHEAKTALSKLIERASAGEEIVIANRGRPVAVLSAYAARPVRFGALALDEEARAALDAALAEPTDDAELDAWEAG
ncbi:MAG: type II toxin-antitoxin system prevent-host-death family antitoxin [Pseudomonadota bacterium]